MSYLTYESLSANSQRYDSRRIINENNSVIYAKHKMIKVFLSHKHDEPISLINQVRGFFLSLNAELYIDWLDKDMPNVVGPVTANHLKNTINAMSKFIVLATPKSIESIWIPWELGLADQAKGLDHIAILPILHSGDDWRQREYYRIYSEIRNENGKWLVMPQGDTGTSTELLNWLQR